MKITLRDIDHRDGDGAPFEFTGGVEDVVKYLDGPVRSDLTDGATSGADLDEAIAALRLGEALRASGMLKPMSIYLTLQPTGAEVNLRQVKARHRRKFGILWCEYTCEECRTVSRWLTPLRAAIWAFDHNHANGGPR